jgi:hypothetical protein
MCRWRVRGYEDPASSTNIQLIKDHGSDALEFGRVDVSRKNLVTQICIIMVVVFEYVSYGLWFYRMC